MPGSHGLAILADNLVKGVPGPNVSVVLAMATKALDNQERGRYATLGYQPLEDNENGASLTLDYAYDDGVGGLIADLAGSPAQAAVWHNRSKNYANIWVSERASACAGSQPARCWRASLLSFACGWTPATSAPHSLARVCDRTRASAPCAPAGRTGRS